MMDTIRHVSAVVLILADLYALRLAPDAGAALPRLPALELWLARGRRVAADEEWRQWLLAEFGGSAGGRQPLAGIAAAGWLTTTRPDRHYWLATPIHAVAGLDTLRLHPAGLLHFDESLQQLLAGDFARVFAGSGWELFATGRRELLLAGPPIESVQTQDPARWLGAELAAATPAGAGAVPLRRMAAELEMWLHGHAANRARLTRGLPIANGMWLWGGGPAAAIAPGRLPVLLGDDLVGAALWRLGGGTAGAVPDAYAAQGERDAVIILPVAGAESLRAIDTRWLAPVLAAVRSGALAEAKLLVAGQRVVMTRALSWRAWRRSSSWWEML